MAALPFRRTRGAAGKATKLAGRLAIADAVWALARDRIATRLPGVEPRRRGPRLGLLAVGGAVAAIGAAAFVKRDKIARLLPGRSDAGTPEPPPPPGPSNYDAGGPVANTATAVPVPPPATPDLPVDEQAEIDAAAAEAANIGGIPTSYAATDPGLTAGEAERPLAESGEGESEGYEQAEAELVEEAILRDAGADPAGDQIDAAIDAQSNPADGETPEPVRPTDEPRP